MKRVLIIEDRIWVSGNAIYDLDYMGRELGWKVEIPNGISITHVPSWFEYEFNERKQLKEYDLIITDMDFPMMTDGRHAYWSRVSRLFTKFGTYLSGDPVRVFGNADAESEYGVPGMDDRIRAAWAKQLATTDPNFTPYQNPMGILSMSDALENGVPVKLWTRDLAHAHYGVWMMVQAGMLSQSTFDEIYQHSNKDSGRHPLRFSTDGTLIVGNKEVPEHWVRVLEEISK